MPENNNKPDIILSTLMAIVILLMIAIAGLFIRMNQLQEKVIVALSSLQGGQSVGLDTGNQAPEFTLVDTAGAEISLKEFSGHWVLLGFTSITCPVCTTTYPHIKAFSEERSDIQVVLISKGSADENRKLAQEQGFRFPVLTMGADQTGVAIEYKVPGTPFFYVLDEEGTIRNVGFANTKEQLIALVEEIVK